MFWDTSEISFKPLMPLILKCIGYSLAIVGGDILYRCTYDIFHEYKNITLCSTKMFGMIRLLLRHKFACEMRNCYLAFTMTALALSSELRETITHSDFWVVFIVTLLAKGLKSYCCQSDDGVLYFIRNSGLDCGSFMAYSFFHGYIKFVVSSNSETSSKGLKERIEDYEATEGVRFPIKKLFILQPQSLYLPPRLDEISDFLENAKSLEEIKINRGGVVGRPYQLSVYKIKGFEGLDWYVTAQGASPLLTYHEECERSKLLDMYKIPVSLSFNEHLKKLILNCEGCKSLVEVIYYNDRDEHDVGLVIKNHIEESLKKTAVNVKR